MATPDDFEPSSPELRDLIDRGFFEAASDLEAIDRAFVGGMVTFYTGYDPTAPSFHAGNLLTIMAMRLLQRHGHRPICLLGSGTAMVGDPSGKTEMRKIIDRETIATNAVAFREQLGRYIHFDRGEPNDAIMLDNADWLLGLSYIEFLRDYGRHFTVNRMVAAKTYRDRLESEQPLSFLEFNYQLLQAYDFLHLFRAQGCTLQTGGGDQWGNMLAGVELIRRVTANQESEREDADAERSAAYCLTYPLLLTADGRKMGKTERGAVWLDPGLLSPYDFYQYWINCDDRDVTRLLRLFTELPLDEVEQLCTAEGAALRDVKARLALEVTRLAHGDEAAKAAQEAARQAFGSGGDWSAVPCIELEVAQIKLVDLVVHERVAAFKSKREARQRIEGGAVKVNGEPIKDPNHSIDASQCGDDGIRLQAGKKHRSRVLLRG
jgi:tyrosyl-tRNA synthetase